MSSDLHPSQLHQHLQMYACAKWSFWGSLVVSCGLLFLGASQKPESKPWILGASVGVLEVGRRHRQTAKLLQESLGDIDRASRINFQALARTQTQTTAQLALTVGAVDANWKPANLTSLLDAIAGKQVRIVAPSGAGKSTIAQYLAYSIGGKVKIYEPEGTPEDWQGLEVVGKGENWTAINQSMAEDLLDLSTQLKTRTDKGDSALAGTDRVYIGEEYPEVRTKCPTADEWLERHARRGRKGRRFLVLLSQFDKVAAWGLEGKSDLIDCFRCIRLGKIAIKHAESLGDEKLVQWIKADSFGRCMIDDEPCQLPAYELMKVVATGKIEPVIVKKTGITADELLATLEYPERDIVDLGIKHQGEWLPAWKCHNLNRSLRTISLEDIRFLFHGFAARGIGEVKDEKERTHWRIDQQHLDNL